ncbi:MAG: Clp protease N-terminal domain-containing protein [Gemmatimonadales bacterium]|nr:Clp protease N-terminal domain-containing protein [Gemmatimonadales bacterium]
MSGTSPTPERSDPIARDVRPLPSNPNLEFERKSAKAFLKQLHAGDADARRRVQASHATALHDRGAEQLQLADAQHVIAREYGFSSWPRLVEYFEELNRHRHAPRYNAADDGAERFEAWAADVVRRHEHGDPIVARELSHFVPRFYARPIADILATAITLDEARLVVARRNRRASWEELLARGEQSRQVTGRPVWDVASSPRTRAAEAIRRHDAAALTAILDAHPEVLAPTLAEREWRSTLGPVALRAERDSGLPEARRVTELLASRGLDVQRELNELLLGWPVDGAGYGAGTLPGTVQWCLDRGADPAWMPPNGIPILEHAIARYRNGAAVDVLATRVTPRRALWIAAGLGDVAGVRSLVAGKGTLTPEGRLNRPDMVAMGLHVGHLPPRHDADDLEIMYEAFQVAGWNERWAAMDALLDAGFPIDHSPHNWPLLREATGNLIVPLAEYLVSRGADLDRDWPGHGSSRAGLRSLVQYIHDPHHVAMTRMLAICGLEPVEEILAEKDAMRPSPPPMDAWATRILQLAADDASRQGQDVITSENLLIAVMRLRNGDWLQFLLGTGTDLPALQERIGARLLPDADPLAGEELPRDAGAEAALATATQEAESRRRDAVGTLHVWYGVVSEEDGPAVQLLRGVGTNLGTLIEGLRTGT